VSGNNLQRNAVSVALLPTPCRQRPRIPTPPHGCSPGTVLGPGRRHAWEWLRDGAATDPRWAVRQMAAQLSILARTQPELAGWLRDIRMAENDRDEDAGQTALRALATGWRYDPHVRILVRDRTKDDPHPAARRTAAEILEFPDKGASLPRPATGCSM
jgi:hypothetical protein